MDDQSMSLEEQERLLLENHSFLVSYLDPDDVADELIQARIIGLYAMQQLQLMGISKANKNQIIVDQLKTAGPGSLKKFCNILRKGGRQRFIADQIEKSKVATHLVSDCSNCSVYFIALSSTVNHEVVRQLTPTTTLDVSSLRARYIRHLSPAYTDWPQQYAYVQLALVKEERVTRADEDIEEITKLTLQGQVDEVLLRKEPLHSLKEIFHYQDKPCPRIILIMGGPGK